MKIVDKETFLKLPSGVLFSFYQRIIFTDLCVKAETISETSDFSFLSIVGNVESGSSEDFFEKCERALEQGERLNLSFDMKDTIREGMFNPEQKFAVYEKEDLAGLFFIAGYVYATYYRNNIDALLVKNKE